MKLTKIAIAAAALAATFSGGFAVAGSFQTNTTNIAREVIITDAQQIVAPQVTYSFQGPVRNPQNDTYFQIQLKLDQGTWKIPLKSGSPDPVEGSTNGNVALVNNAGLVISTANAISIDAQTLKATFRVPAGPGENNARVIFNAAGNHAASGAAPLQPAQSPHEDNLIRISGLKSVVGDVLECDVSIRNITGSVTQYPNISDLSYTAGTGDESPASEHKYPGSQNSGPVASFPTNLLLTGTADGLVATQDYARQGMLFKHTDGATPNVTNDGKAVRLGIVSFSQRANGYDANLRTVYGSATPDVEVKTAAGKDDGTIELQSLDLALAGSFSESAKFWLAPQTANGPNACAANVPNGNASVLAGDKLSALLTYTGALSKTSNLALCYGVDGTKVIPTTAISATVVMNKALDGKSDSDTIRFQEQNNSCKAQFNVGGGIRIDVRNYASYAKFGDSGTSSTLRIINNSETATADLFAQMIYADGTYGAWGKLPDLKPRAAANYSNRELESFMTNAAAATNSNPFGNNAAAYAETGGSTVSAHTKAGVGDRVRIVSTTGSTLRVQSYISSGPVMIDTSGAQGVDFEGLNALQNGRAPTTDGQPISQDAINGLSRR